MVRGWVVMMLAVACVEPRPSGDHATDPTASNDADLLVDDVGDLFADRTRVGMFSGASLTPEGPVGFAETSFHRPLVVVDPGDRIRVVFQSAQMQMLLHLTRDGLREVVWHRTTVTARPESGRMGASLPVGVEVEVVDRKDGLLKIEAANRQITLRGWVPQIDVDQWWTPDSVPAVTAEPTTANVALRGEAVLLDAPWGEPFGVIDAFSEAEPDLPFISATALGHTVDEHIEVQARIMDWDVHGWVHESQVAPEVEGGRGFGYSFGCGGVRSGSWSTFSLPANTLLSAEPFGQPVARTTVRVGTSAPSESSPTVRVVESTPWGPMELYAWADQVEDNRCGGPSGACPDSARLISQWPAGD